MNELDLSDCVRHAMDHANALDAVHAIYARLQSEIDRRKPICVTSGKCCNFESYGHRLFVTTLELATFVQDLDNAPVTRASGPCAAVSNRQSLKILTQPPRAGGPCHDEIPAIGPGCPLQIDGLCSVHPIRPFGCRIFFCDPTAGDWQQEQYELFHAELKQLHERFEIPYLYLEWRLALAKLGIQ